MRCKKSWQSAGARPVPGPPVTGLPERARLWTMVGRSCIGGVVLLALAAPVLAHGGMYRGPFDPRPGAPGNPGVPAGPTTPGGPFPPSPLTGGGTDLSTWEFWWEYNREPYLRLKDAVHAAGVQSGGDDFYFGPSRRKDAPTLAPTAADRRDRVVPALAGQLGATDNRDLVTACLVALGKIGLDAPGAPLIDLLARHLPQREQEIRETAALAMGISGREDALLPLLALHRNAPEGRQLADRSDRVEDRMRAFAGYGLGLLAARSEDMRTKTAVFEALAATLADKQENSRDVVIAAIHGIRLLDVGGDGSAAGKRLQWRALAVLEAELDRERTRTWQVVQAHAPAAVARLIGRGHGVDHQRWKKRFARLLDPAQRQNHALAQSAALALGVICEMPETWEEDAEQVAALERYYEHGKDAQARMFCLLALGQIGGRGCVGKLTRVLERGNDLDRAWAALALGIAARAALEDPALLPVRADAAAALLRSLSRSRAPDLLSSHAIALGLAGWIEGAPVLRRQLAEHEKQDDIAGYTCLGLALMRDPDAAEPIRDLVERSHRRPALMRQAATALALLGDKTATELLLDQLRKGDTSTARLAAFARALGFIGDRSTIDPLLALLRDESVTILSRAFVAAALGTVCDPLPLPWHSRISTDANYRADVETLTDRRAGVLDIL